MLPSFPPGTPRYYEPLLHEPTYRSPGISQINDLLPSQDSSTQRLAAIDREIRADITSTPLGIGIAATHGKSVFPQSQVVVFLAPSGCPLELEVVLEQKGG